MGPACAAAHPWQRRSVYAEVTAENGSTGALRRLPYRVPALLPEVLWGKAFLVSGDQSRLSN